jgi:hypothetical protein
MRYVIKKPGEGYFTEFEVVETRAVVAPLDMVIHAGHPPVKKGEIIGTESNYRPLFEAFKPSQAIKFDTPADAEGQIANPDPSHGGPAAFADCIVEPELK